MSGEITINYHCADSFFDSGIDLMGAGQGREGPGWGPPFTLPISLLPLSRPLRTIPEIFIKNVLHNDIFPGHSNSLMTLVEHNF